MSTETDFTPYCHLEICDKCGHQKMCVEGFRQAGNEKPTTFFECEDCAQEIKRGIEARMKGQL